MKKLTALTLALILILALSGCGKSKAATEADNLIAEIGDVSIDSGDAIAAAEQAVDNLESKDKETLENLELLDEARAEYDDLVEQERIRDLVASEVWYGIYDGDAYSFSEDGTGTHDNTTIEYDIDNGVINISEGAAGTTKVTMTIDENGAVVKLVPEDSEIYYARESDYDALSEEIQAEYTAELTRHEAWTVRKGSQFEMYFMFYDGGSGFAVTTAGTVGLTWEYVDNNTIKTTISSQSSEFDIVVEDGEYTLVQAIDGSTVTATPND